MTQSNALVVLPAYGNDFEALINETILPVAMSRLRGQLTMPKLITVNKADESKKVGELIRVNKPVEFDKADEHGTGGSVATDLNVSEVELRLDRHVYKEFKMSDREFTGMQPGVIPDSLAAAVDVLARTVNEAIFDMYTEVPYFSGLLTSTNPRDKRDLIQNRKGLHNRMVLGDKNLVLTSDSRHKAAPGPCREGQEARPEQPAHPRRSPRSRGTLGKQDQIQFPKIREPLR